MATIKYKNGSNGVNIESILFPSGSIDGFSRASTAGGTGTEKTYKPGSLPYAIISGTNATAASSNGLTPVYGSDPVRRPVTNIGSNYISSDSSVFSHYSHVAGIYTLYGITINKTGTYEIDYSINGRSPNKSYFSVCILNGSADAVIVNDLQLTSLIPNTSSPIPFGRSGINSINAGTTLFVGVSPNTDFYMEGGLFALKIKKIDDYRSFTYYQKS